MAARSTDPYKTLGVSASVTDAELRSAYRRLVLLHHPDHNGGSPESARRFEEVQEAYARIRALRAGSPTSNPASNATSNANTRRAERQQPPRPTPPADPELDARIAALERELREAQKAREQAREAARESARQAAREAAADPGQGTKRRASDEELGYIKTDDSFTKIIDDALSGLGNRVSEVRNAPIRERLADELEELAAKLTHKQRPPSE